MKVRRLRFHVHLSLASRNMPRRAVRVHSSVGSFTNASRKGSKRVSASKRAVYLQVGPFGGNSIPRFPRTRLLCPTCSNAGCNQDAVAPADRVPRSASDKAKMSSLCGMKPRLCATGRTTASSYSLRKKKTCDSCPPRLGDAEFHPFPPLVLLRRLQALHGRGQRSPYHTNFVSCMSFVSRAATRV